MVLIRRCEEQLARSHQKGLIHGACHTYVGQEAIAAGVVCPSAAATTWSSAPTAATAMPWPRG